MRSRVQVSLPLLKIKELQIRNGSQLLLFCAGFIVKIGKDLRRSSSREAGGRERARKRACGREHTGGPAGKHQPGRSGNPKGQKGLSMRETTEPKQKTRSGRAGTVGLLGKQPRRLIEQCAEFGGIITNRQRDDPTLPIQQKIPGDIPARIQSENRGRWIQTHRKGISPGRTECLQGLTCLTPRNAQKCESLPGKPIHNGFLNRGQLIPALRTPRRKKGQQDDATPQVRQPNRRAVNLIHREIRGQLPDLDQCPQVRGGIPIGNTTGLHQQHRHKQRTVQPFPEKIHLTPVSRTPTRC